MDPELANKQTNKQTPDNLNPIPKLQTLNHQLKVKLIKYNCKQINTVLNVLNNIILHLSHYLIFNELILI